MSVLERGKTNAFANAVSEALARLPSRRGPAAPAGAVTAAAVSDDPRESLRRLQSLRDEGLITDAEYAAKRNEILARM